MARLVIPMRCTIEAPPQKVFDYLADITKHPEWATNPLTVELVSGDVGKPGTTYRSRADFMGKKGITADVTVIACEPPSRLALTSKEEDQVYAHEYTLTPANGGTTLERTITTEIPGIKGAITKMVVGFLAPGLTKKNVAMLKQRLEG